MRDLLVNNDVVSNARNPQFYPLFGLTSNKLQSTLEALDGYWKAKSTIYLDVLGLPTLKGIAVKAWDEHTKVAVRDYLASRGWKSVVIRSDKQDETGIDIPVGGYLVDVANLDAQVKRFFMKGRIIMLLEPRNRYMNKYGVNVLYDSSSPNSLYLEVVGLGFDVSDINRGDITPHEHIELSMTSTDQLVLSRSAVSQTEYDKSVFYRLAKIGKLNMPENFIAKSENDLADLGRQFLKNNGYDLLFQQDNYQAIPLDHLKRIHLLMRNLPKRMHTLGLDVTLFVISATIFFENDELVFWDIVWPKHKYKVKASG